MKKSTLLSGLLLVLLGAAGANARVTTAASTDIWCVGPSGAEWCVDSSGNLLNTTDNDGDIGTSSLGVKTIYSYDITANDDLTVTDDAEVNGDTTLGDARGDTVDLNVSTITVNADVHGLTISTHTGTAAGSPTIIRIDGSNRRVCIGCDLNQDPEAQLQVLDGGLRLGTGSTPDVTLSEDDAFIEDTLEVDGAARFDANVTVGDAVGDVLDLNIATVTISNVANAVHLATATNATNAVLLIDGLNARLGIGLAANDAPDNPLHVSGIDPIKLSTMTATYVSGSAFLCINDSGVIIASEAVCP